MPIHDQGYRRYAGERAPRGRAWSVIARAGVRASIRRRAFVGLLIVAWLPFFVRAVQIYASSNLPQAEFLAPDVQMFRQFLEQQDVFIFFVTVYAGAGLIANDRRANALQVYLSKPLTRAEYIFGKFAVLATFLLLVGWAPAILLLLVQIVLSGSVAFFVDNLVLLPAITVFSFIQVVTIGAVMLGLSSLSNSSRFVGILFAALTFFTQAVYGVLWAVTRDSALSWVSLSYTLAHIGDAVFQLPLRYRTPIPVSGMVIVGAIAASAWILERRIRGVEVVA